MVYSDPPAMRSTLTTHPRRAGRDDLGRARAVATTADQVHGTATGGTRGSVDLNSRDLAAVVGICLVAALLWRNHALGGIVRSLLRVLASRLLIEFVALAAVWTVLLVLAAQRVGPWTPAMLHDTVLALVPAISILMGSSNAAAEEGWYRKRLRRAATWTVLVEVVVGLSTYNLVVEVALLVFGSIAAGIAALAGSSHDTTGGVAPRWARRAVTIVGLFLVGGPVLYLIQHASTLDARDLGLRLFLPVWLAVLTLPLAWYLSLAITHDDAQSQLRWRADDHPRWHQRLALLLGFNVHARALRAFMFSNEGMRRLAATTGFRESWSVVRRPPPDQTLDDEENDNELPLAEEPTPANATRRKRERPHGHRRSR